MSGTACVILGGAVMVGATVAFFLCGWMLRQKKKRIREQVYHDYGRDVG